MDKDYVTRENIIRIARRHLSTSPETYFHGNVTLYIKGILTLPVTWILENFDRVRNGVCGIPMSNAKNSISLIVIIQTSR